MNTLVTYPTGKPLEITLDYLPLCIAGAPGAGSSLFTMTLAAQLLASGQKLLVMSGYTRAVDELRNQIRQPINLVTKLDQIDPHDHLIYLEPQNITLLQSTLERADAISRRVVLIKNYELFCPEDTIDRLVTLPNLILSGKDIPVARGGFLWKSTVAFIGANQSNPYAGRFRSGPLTAEVGVQIAG